MSSADWSLDSADTLEFDQAVGYVWYLLRSDATYRDTYPRFMYRGRA